MSSLRRAIAIVLALGGAAGFAISVEIAPWWAIIGAGTDVGVGTVSTRRCFGGDCQVGGLAWTGGSELWMRAGFATYAAGLCAALALIALAGALATKRAGRLLGAVVGVASLTAIAAGAVFVHQHPPLPSASAGYGLYLFAGAVAAAIVAAALTLSARPTAP